LRLLAAGNTNTRQVIRTAYELFSGLLSIFFSSLRLSSEEGLWLPRLSVA
jgi:hypothetical protein